MRRKLLSIFLILFCTFSAFSQEEDSDWFWGHPISKIEFEGLKVIKKAELTGVSSSYIGELFTEELYSEIVDRLNELEFFEDIEQFLMDYEEIIKHRSRYRINNSKISRNG